jgi:hypothetical protein
MFVICCTAYDMDWGLQMYLEQERQRVEILHEHDCSAEPVCTCERTSWIPCPESVTSPETHDSETCLYGCFEDTVPCPFCEGEPVPPLILDPYQDPPEPDPIAAEFDAWVSSLR